jgi:hypothetical protein
MLFHEPTKMIYDWIQQQPNVKEESITDWLLFVLSIICPQLRYYAFTRHEETRNGADWEWWVLTPHYAYRFRVQAKKLKPKADNYSSICYSNDKGLQIDLLLENAKHYAFPLYMFYSAVEQDATSFLEHYPVHKLIEMIEWCKACSSGAYLTPASLVYDEVLAKPKRKITATTLVNNSLKLSTLDLVLRQPNGQTMNSEVEKLLNSLYKHHESKYDFRYEYEGDNNKYQHLIMPHLMPRWLMYILQEKQLSNMELSDWFESEFRSQLPDVSGVVVLDLREGL